MPEQNPFEPSGYNCLISLINVGSFVAGIYHGLSDAKGVPMSPSLENTLTYLPSVAGGLAATSLPERFKNFLPPIPSGAEGCSGCVGFASGAIVAGAFNGAGYLLGRVLG